jgi:long-subunit fatty acid transport protein
MNRLYRSMLIAACFFLSVNVNGQTDIDALRYSKSSFGTTARSMSMGGAFGALGADFSVLAQNPAGIALYRKNEFTISPLFNYTNATTDFLNNNNSDGRFNFGFSDFGLIFTHNLKNGHGWKNWNMGFGYNRINSFSGRTYYEGKNNENTLLDSYVEELNGTDPDNIFDVPSLAAEAYNVYLLDSFNGNQYYNALPNAGELQRKNTRTRGSMGEWDLSFGGNYNDRLYIGATIGFTTLRYIEDSRYEEIDVTNMHDSIAGLDFSSFYIDQYINTRGTGFNFKIGAIYRPADWVRIGASFHTPTYYHLSDDYSSYIMAYYEGGFSSTSSVLYGVYDYNLTTPLKAIGSVAFIINNFGLISADYEYLNYADAKLNSPGYHFSAENNDIDRKYRAASNFKAGAEYKYRNLSFRIGGAYFGTPFQSNLNKKSEDQHQVNYTAGFGIRGQNAFIDFGYALAMSTEYYAPYGLSNEPVPGIVTKTTDNRVLITFGVKW